MTNHSDIRSAVVAGQFYPASPSGLQATISSFLCDGDNSKQGKRLRALVVPHAGYTYSGSTAGKAYGLVGGDSGIERVVVLAPSHRTSLRSVSVGEYSAFATPLGDVLVDTDACRRLEEANSLVTARTDAHASEHALEVQLPFIQTVLPEAMLVPIICGQLDLGQVREVAAALAKELWREDTLWVISTDFTHFGSSFRYTPFHDDVPRRLEELDRGAIDCILQRDCEGFWNYVARTQATICGRVPVAILLAVLEEAGGTECELLEYTTSGRMSGDFSHSVSYAALAVSEPDGSPEERLKDGGAALVLTPEDRQMLLKLARDTIHAALGEEELEEPLPLELSDALTTDAACFVTLHSGGRLRGCIGHLEASEPLYRNVIHNARSAAFRDHRFSPLTQAEFEDIDIEISVLTPSREIAGIDAFQIGRHGIILRKGRARAVFLPQVAPEQGWDKETTLRHLSMKAGLGAEDWREGAEFAVFEAIVFGELGKGD